MMKTKYIKVAVSERLPDESTELYFYCNDGYCNAGDYNKERNVFKDVDGTRYGVEYIEYWLEEIPDREDEMKEMLEKVCTELYRTDNSMATEVKDLLNSIK